MMDHDRFNKYYNGARSAIDVALWNIQQITHLMPTAELETLARQTNYSICSADTILQVLANYCEPDEEEDEDDDDEDDDLLDPETSK